MDLPTGKIFKISLSNGWNFTGEISEVNREYVVLWDNKRGTPIKIVQSAIITVEEVD